MSAEDYEDVPGLGAGFPFPPDRRNAAPYKCRFCKSEISFKNRKPLNPDGTAHHCKAYRAEKQAPAPAVPADPQPMLYALAAMNAIIGGQIQAGGVNFIHSMNFHDVADAAWQVAAAMVSAEKNHRDEFGG